MEGGGGGGGVHVCVCVCVCVCVSDCGLQIPGARRVFGLLHVRSKQYCVEYFT